MKIVINIFVSIFLGSCMTKPIPPESHFVNTKIESALITEYRTMKTINVTQKQQLEKLKSFFKKGNPIKGGLHIGKADYAVTFITKDKEIKLMTSKLKWESFGVMGGIDHKWYEYINSLSNERLN